MTSIREAAIAAGLSHVNASALTSENADRIATELERIVTAAVDAAIKGALRDVTERELDDVFGEHCGPTAVHEYAKAIRAFLRNRREGLKP